ncbi:unnamed protein product [Brugia timori]|uniref:Uncharacterized protein n=1 Tax=Brugia timori TaxID=42155 RepID=A0A0R3Q9W4_9BILA|nr:unnamed protein product [Brugia timori]
MLFHFIIFKFRFIIENITSLRKNKSSKSSPRFLQVLPNDIYGKAIIQTTIGRTEAVKYHLKFICTTINIISFLFFSLKRLKELFYKTYFLLRKATI